MHLVRVVGASIILLGLTCAPLIATTAPLGTVITADRAHIGETAADVGTTIYSGDRVSTDSQGSLQLRAGAARFLLFSSSAAIVDNTEGSPSARLLLGTATFSTGNAHAFTLYASNAVVRAQTDAPTVGTVTYVNEKELVVTARRSGLVVTVEGDEQVIAEGTSYRVLLDPQGPEGAGAGQQQGGKNKGAGGPLAAGRSRFLIIATALIIAGTGVAIAVALESPWSP
jgi:hypothetical protein